MSGNIIPIVYLLGVGGIGGFFVGYASKKILKIIAVMLGIYCLSLVVLDYMGVMKVNYEGLVNVSLSSILSNLPLLGSFVMGFVIGYAHGDMSNRVTHI